jgi:pilus assembly protein CpaF
MRPELLIVGEVREAESLDLLIAMNSGLPGLCTIHANSAAEAIQKLCTLPLLAGANISADFVKTTVANCIDIVVHCEMTESGQRRVNQIAAVDWNSKSAEVRVELIDIGQSD